ncbi:aminoglycoside phosphotransferase family protein [Streptomyces sp. NBC_01260]|uniref:phosphotransferase n=1 Tax=unclassified Streptomyces TaxID=2593676 RepID=UPI00225A02AC|nr:MULTISPECIES: phosphotransferase [unclassified Streptomyces]MCX4771861.1 aminoglycoside phosphotransferase family protein [Streptomyces sp. NBC_01285]
MRDDASAVTVERGRYPDAVTPWQDPAWREAALAWAERTLAAHGLRTTRRLAVRLRPWSVLVRMTAEGEPDVWFKANPAAAAFEAGLAEALARWVPGHVLEPLAVDAARGWSLLPHGGTLFRDTLRQDPADERAWEEPLRQYAAMQRALGPRAGEMGQLGVPDARMAVLPATFDRLVEENATLDPATRTALRELRPRFNGWCDELAATGIPDSLDHADLHDGQFFAPGPGRFTFFDWGDAALSHPFCSLLVPLRTAAERHGPQVLPKLRDAYLDPWTDTGLTPAELRRAVSLAWRLAAVGRACSWGRLFPGAGEAPATTGDAESARWLRELFAEPVF